MSPPRSSMRSPRSCVSPSWSPLSLSCPPQHDDLLLVRPGFGVCMQNALWRGRRMCAMVRLWSCARGQGLAVQLDLHSEDLLQGQLLLGSSQPCY